MVTPSDLSFDVTGTVLLATSTVVILAADWSLSRGAEKDHL